MPIAVDVDKLNHARNRKTGRERGGGERGRRVGVETADERVPVERVVPLRRLLVVGEPDGRQTCKVWTRSKSRDENTGRGKILKERE